MSEAVPQPDGGEQQVKAPVVAEAHEVDTFHGKLPLVPPH